MACGMLVPPRRIELTPSVVKVQTPNPWTTRASSSNTNFIYLFIFSNTKFKRCTQSNIHSSSVHDSQDIEGT